MSSKLQNVPAESINELDDKRENVVEQKYEATKWRKTSHYFYDDEGKLQRGWQLEKETETELGTDEALDLLLADISEDTTIENSINHSDNSPPDMVTESINEPNGSKSDPILINELGCKDELVSRSNLSCDESTKFKKSESSASILPPTVLTAPEPVLSSANYIFPVPADREYRHVSNKDLNIALTKLNHSFASAKSAHGYFTVRDEICAIHIEMNCRQEHAPRFRSLVDLKQFPSSPEEEYLSIDRQIIDMHWVANSKLKTSALIAKLPMMNGDATFDFEEASNLARKPWTAETKAVELLLSKNLQWQCATLQSKAIRDQWRVILKGDVRGRVVKQRGVGHIEIDLQNAILSNNNTSTLQHIPGMLNVWKADCIVKSDPKKIAGLVALMTGEKPRDVSAVKKTLQSLNSYLTIARRIAA